MTAAQSTRHTWTLDRRKQVVRQATYLDAAITDDLAADDTVDNYLDRCSVLNQLEQEWRHLGLPRQWLIEIRSRYINYGRSRRWPTNVLLNGSSTKEFPF